MSDYIDKWELIEKMEWDNDIEKWTIWEDDLKSIPSADVAPVRHGQWIPSDYTGDCCYTCSECGFERDAYLLDVGNYCPNCGCCMLGGGEDDTVSDKQ